MGVGFRGQTNGVRAWGAALGAAVALVWAGVSVAQGPSPAGVTAEQIESRLAELESGAGDAVVDPQARAAADLYRTALGRMRAAAASEAAIDRLRQEASSVASALETAAAWTDTAAEGLADLVKPPPDAPPDQLESALSQRRGEADDARTELADVNERLTASLARRETAERERAELRRVTAAEPGPAAAGDGDADPAAVAEARRLLAAASRSARTARLAELEQELAVLPARRELLRARRERASARVAALDAAVAGLEHRLDTRRLAAARAQEAASAATRERLDGAHPAVASAAADNGRLGLELREVTEALDAAGGQLAAARAAGHRLRTTRQSADEVLAIGSGGRAFAQLLRELRERLPAASELDRNADRHDREVVQARMRRLRLVRGMESGGGVDRGDAPAAQAAITDADQAALDGLAATRRGLIDQLVAIYGEQIDRLGRLKAEEQELRRGTLALRDELDERLTWLPSATALGPAWAGQVASGAAAFADPGHAGAVASSLWRRLVSAPLLPCLLLVLAVLLRALRSRLRSRLVHISSLVGRVYSDHFLLTPRAILITLLLAAPWPLLLGTLGGRLATDAVGTDFSRAVGAGVLAVAAVTLVLYGFAVMCRDHGLFGAHFEWSERARRRLARNLMWLLPLEAACGFVVATTAAAGVTDWDHGLGRLAFMVGSLGLSLFTWRVLHPRRGVTAEFVRHDTRVGRSRAVWFPLAVALPAALGALAAVGYYNTASEIQSRLFTSVSVAGLGLVVYSVAMRWVVVAHRRLAIERARAERDERRAAAADRAAEPAAPSGDAVPAAAEPPRIDLSSVSDQTRTVLRVVVAAAVAACLWWVWRGLFPALGVLDDITVWTTTAVTSEGERAVPVTVWGLLRALLTLALTWVAAKNLPGVLEITLLQRLRLDTGTRYAVVTVCRYVIIGIGVTAAFDQLGVPWSRLQWIVAALGVGLGFGLQEIVANFVSGLIILFERPVRIGDTVTVNGLSGTVSRIQIRATTITDWDNKEILVPNKSFITDQVVNWTLSDPVTRLLLKVGVAYGTDTDLAHRVILDAAKGNPLVLDQPEPAVFFMGFGDSSLDFELRVFVSELSRRLPVLHGLHTAINRALAAEGIDIPFPQRDVHVRDLPSVRTLPGDDPADGGTAEAT